MAQKYRVEFTKKAAKEFKKIRRSEYFGKLGELLEIIEQNPFQIPPPYEVLEGKLAGRISRRINIQHRLVYTVKRGAVTVNGARYAGIITVEAVWNHYTSLSVLSLLY